MLELQQTNHQKIDTLGYKINILKKKLMGGRIALHSLSWYSRNDLIM